ncbi:MAG: hypothetical protein LUQ50_10285 [Methanospirillum sp.]|uniref:hypothetical protein n=1 Tax=Methanospirillum sp. TaxID=45200 RepID=UPI002376459F|nr:hypothetical protein [Methanospirillum sp.]MDD1729446.1 hypothetical protein [Methanospirillum sp.]
MFINLVLISPVIAADTSNWVNVSSNIGVNFSMPPNWAWDPVDLTSLGIRTDKSDAVLIIGCTPLNVSVSEARSENITRDVTSELSDLHVPNVSEVKYDNKTAIASGTTLDGTIIDYIGKFENNHYCRWVSEYSDSDAVIKYADTFTTIIEGTTFF